MPATRTRPKVEVLHPNVPSRDHVRGAATSALLRVLADRQCPIFESMLESHQQDQFANMLAHGKDVATIAGAMGLDLEDAFLETWLLATR